MNDPFRAMYKSIRIGDRVRVNYGCQHPQEYGVVVRKYMDDWGQWLLVKMEDGSFEHVKGLASAENTIGAHLVERR